MAGLGSVADLFLVRHGESEWNLGGWIQGQSPVAGGLTERGRDQAARAAVELAGRGALSVVASDLVRARETAEIIAGQLTLPLSVDSALREQHLGEYQGQSVAACDAEVDRLWEEPFRRPPGGESVAEMHVRVHRALRKYAGSPAVVVTHGGVVRVAIAAAPVRGRPVFRSRVENASVTLWRST